MRATIQQTAADTRPHPTLARKRSIVAAAAAALALTFGAAAYAQPAADGAGGPAPRPMWHHGGFEHDLKALHDKLNLNADQEKLWQAANDTMKRNREAQRELHRQMAQQIKSASQQNIIDMNALHAAQQQIASKRQQLREQTATAWLNFYNALNDQQKTTVSSEMKKHWARMEQMRAKMHERWQKHHGGKDGNMAPPPGGPEAPAPASAQ